VALYWKLGQQLLPAADLERSADNSKPVRIACMGA
jgi:hypothetical protein